MTPYRVSAIVFRFFFAALSLTAVTVQLFAVTVAKGYGIVDFFSYFTNLSNILISIVFIVSAVRLITNRKPTDTDVAIRGGAVVYILFVGLVFNTLLRDVDLGDLIPWVNAIVHFTLPIAGLVDWLIWPPQRRIPLRTAFLWLIFPAVYVAYSLIRGVITGFYPYPFFNPDAVGGYGGVALYCFAMLIGFLALALLIRWLGNLRHAQQQRSAAGAATA